MAWNIAAAEYQRYQRNTLAAVISQLRYHPILKVTRDAVEFQDVVRQRFPRSARRSTTRQVDLGPNGVSVSEQPQFEFDNLEGTGKLALAAESMSLTYRKHESMSVFLGDFELAVDALERHYAPVVPTRLGLRYVNVIDKAQISAELGDDVEWVDLVQEAYLAGPRQFADDKEALWVTECRAAVSGGTGAMTMRFGMVRDAGQPHRVYRLDIDRYVGGGMEMAAVKPILDEFAKDIYAVFRDVAGPGLLEWMKPVTVDARS